MIAGFEILDIGKQDTGCSAPSLRQGAVFYHFRFSALGGAALCHQHLEKVSIDLVPRSVL